MTFPFRSRGIQVQTVILMCLQSLLAVYYTLDSCIRLSRGGSAGIIGKAWESICQKGDGYGDDKLPAPFFPHFVMSFFSIGACSLAKLGSESMCPHWNIFQLLNDFFSYKKTTVIDPGNPNHHILREPN